MIKLQKLLKEEKKKDFGPSILSNPAVTKINKEIDDTVKGFVKNVSSLIGKDVTITHGLSLKSDTIFHVKIKSADVVNGEGVWGQPRIVFKVKPLDDTSRKNLKEYYGTMEVTLTDNIQIFKYVEEK